MPTVLTKDDIKYHEASSERFTLLFWHNNRLLRSYLPQADYIFHRVKDANHPLVQPATLSEFTLDVTTFGQKGAPSEVYEHKIYTHRIRIQEMPLTAAKTFVATLARFNADLLGHGLIAKDIHESNAVETIEGIKWLDYGAIVETSTDNCGTAFVLLSYLVQKYILRKLKCNAYETCLDDVRKSNDVMSTFADRDFTQPATWLEIADAVEKIPVALETSHWSENYSNTMEIDNPASLGLKGINVNSIIEELKCETVTDVACNKGYYSFLAAKHAKSVIGFDIVPACIGLAQNFQKQFKLPAMFAVKTIESMRANAAFETIRYKSDLVMALAIVHHIKSIVAPSEFVEMLLSISNKYILIEDIDQRDFYEKCFLEQGCELIKRVDSIPAPRSLSLYRKL